MSLDRKIVLFLVWIVVAIGFVVLAYTARAADPTDCHALGLQIGQIVKTATDDIDLQQAVEASAEARCILLDEPPLSVKVEAPSTAPLAPSAKDKWCRSHFGSYRVSDGTVLPRGRKTRAACPWPG